MFKIFRKRGRKFHIRSCRGMDEAQDPGMKGLALELIRAPGRSIDLVSQQRVSQARHMDTDLMGTARFQTALNMGKARKALQHPVMGHHRMATRKAA